MNLSLTFQNSPIIKLHNPYCLKQNYAIHYITYVTLALLPYFRVIIMPVVSSDVLLLTIGSSF